MRSTKKSLIMSTISLVLCFAMLLGSTYAWFTDEVTSGSNRIVAGNLDIDVLHTSASVSTATSISAQTNLFRDVNGNEMKWEPGAVSYETFTVKNLGSLALKYNLSLNITDYNAVSGTNDTLKEALKVKVLTGESILGTVNRENVTGLTWTDSVTLDQFTKSGGALYPVGTTGKASEEIFQVIVYWQPTDNDNRWNVNNTKTTTDGKPLFIEFGINVIASQLQHENDSFGSDYDSGIVLPDLPVSINKTFQSDPITSTTVSNDVKVKNASTNGEVATMPAAAVNAVVGKLTEQATDKKEYSDVSTVIYLKVETTDKKETAVTYNIGLSATMTYTDTTGATKTATLENLDGNMGNQVITAVMNIGKGLSDVTVKHNNVAMSKLASATATGEGYFYDKATGDLTIKSTSFSPFTVAYTIDAEAVVGSTPYATLAEAIANAQDGAVIVLNKDAELSTVNSGKVGLLIDKSITLNGNGKTITVTGNNASDSYGIYVNSQNAINATIQNLTLNTTNTERAIRFGGAAGGTVKNVKITTNAVGIHVKGTGAVTIDDVDITVNTISAFTAHKRAGIVVGAETTATMNDSKIVINTTDKTDDTLTWGKGAYVGTNAKGKLILNNTDITADFALAIDGSSDENKLNNITVNSGKIVGDLGSPGGYSYKEIVINGGTFDPYSVNGMNSSFADKTTSTHRMIINGGTFSTQPDNKFIADGAVCAQVGNKYIVGTLKTEIATKEDLLIFAAAVNSGAKTANATLTDDIDLTGVAWTPIGNGFAGTFDGNGKTVSNLTVNSEVNYAGLFGNVFGGTIKDLTVTGANVNSTGENYAGVLVGGGYAKITNCAVKNSSVTGVDQVGAIIGYLSCGSVNNCVVENCTIKANGDRAGGITGKANVDSEYEISGNTVKNCSISAAKKVGEMRSAAGIVGQIMASASNTWKIQNNSVINVTTTTADDNTFVPVGEFRSGSYQANAVTDNHIIGNSWSVTGAADTYDLVNPNNNVEKVTITNAVEN